MVERELAVAAVAVRTGLAAVLAAPVESKDASVDISLILGKQLTITGSGLRPQTVERKAEIARQLRERVWPLLEASKIKPVIDSLYRLADVAEAHRRMESSEHIGKIVLRMG